MIFQWYFQLFSYLLSIISLGFAQWPCRIRSWINRSNITNLVELNGVSFSFWKLGILIMIRGQRIMIYLSILFIDGYTSVTTLLVWCSLKKCFESPSRILVSTTLFAFRSVFNSSRASSNSSMSRLSRVDEISFSIIFYERNKLADFDCGVDYTVW